MSAPSESGEVDLSAFEGHTPGPWTVNDHRDDEECIYIEGENTGIATVFDHELCERDLADAHLIAAAPTLLAELRALRAQVGRLTTTATALCDKLDAVTEATSGIFTLAYVRGMEYTGPNYGDELAAMRRALAPQPEVGE